MLDLHADRGWLLQGLRGGRICGGRIYATTWRGGQPASSSLDTSSIREGSRLERAFRDLYTGTQHALISEKVAIDAAQIWLGIIEDHPGL